MTKSPCDFVEKLRNFCFFTFIAFSLEKAINALQLKLIAGGIMAQIPDDFLESQIEKLNKDIEILEEKQKYAEETIRDRILDSRQGWKGVFEQIKGNNRYVCYQATFELESIELNLFYIKQFRDFLQMLKQGNINAFTGFVSHMLRYYGEWMATHTERMRNCQNS